MAKRTQEMKEFIAAALEAPPGPCVLWPYYKCADGYGRLRMAGERRAHRAIFTLCKGQIPTGHVVMHTCDIPACVNPHHLEVGTHKDNTADMMCKGRGKRCLAPGNFADNRGERHGRAKLSERDVLAIRAAHVAGSTDVSATAANYGVSRQAISDIVRRTTWRHI